MALLLAVLSSRYRDIPQIVQSAMAVIFLVTPVLWDPANVDRSLLLVTFNPFHYLVDVVRGPLLDKPFEPLSWLVVLLMTAVGTTATFLSLPDIEVAFRIGCDPGDHGYDFHPGTSCVS